MTAAQRILALITVVFIGLLDCMGSASGENGPSEATMRVASSGVVQVISRGCSDQNRTGSGFLWDVPTQLVTALHVIAECRDVVAYFSGIGEAPAVLRRSLLTADLALLEVPVQTTARPLRISNSRPQVNETLQVIGYYFSAPSLDSRPLHVTLGSPILGNMVTDHVRSILAAAGSPSLSTEILRLDGNLVPGLSGAPLIDATGGVVGIGSGGLENGTVGISWAIQAHYLTDLKNASISTLASSKARELLFSAPAEGVGVRPIRCGDLVFSYVKTRTLSGLLATADDIPGLVSIATTAGISDEQVERFEYDVYADQDFGGSVSLPKGVHLIPRDDLCVAYLPDGLEIMLGSAKVRTMTELQQVSSVFDTKGDTHNLQWGPDPAFTYFSPMTRPDGLIVRRNAAIGYDVQNGGAPAANAFETLMSRGAAFVGVRVVNTNYKVALYHQCRWQPLSPGCLAVLSHFESWVAAALGIQMSTFPPT